MSDTSIAEQVENCPHRIHTDGSVEDFCDGSVFAKHALFSRDPHALQIIAYFDEVEICNPLGSHVKRHKLGIVFYTLANIDPKYRSQLRLINLVIVAAVPIIEKHGLNKVLEPFIVDLNILSTKGINVSISGVEKNYKGALLSFLADNLASNDLGGFKKSFSFSFRSCRTCLATKESFRNSFTSEEFELRTETNHLRQLELLNGDKDTAAHYSKTYGINMKSGLLDVNYFSMFGGGLPHDAMHDILEGIAPLEIKLLLRHFVTSKLFSLRDFNSKLVNFNYGYMESDKPIPILSQVLNSQDKSIRSSSSEMLVLIRVLPFLIADKILENDDHWRCFLLLRKIVDDVLCPVASENLCSSLKLTIREHHTLFVCLYGPATLIPKMHFLLHYPDQIKAVGPMVRTWTIRHEAKLNFFKQAAHLANFKNVASSLAKRQQRWFCYEFASGKLVDAPLECGPPEHGTGVTVVKDRSEATQASLANIFPQISPQSTIFQPKWVQKNGTRYSNNNVYVIIRSDGLDPVFGRLDELMVIGGDLVIFVLTMCKVLCFDTHYHAYAIEATSSRLLTSELFDHNVYHGHMLSNGHTYITLKYRFVS